MAKPTPDNVVIGELLRERRVATMAARAPGLPDAARAALRQTAAGKTQEALDVLNTWRAEQGLQVKL